MPIDSTGFVTAPSQTCRPDISPDVSGRWQTLRLPRGFCSLPHPPALMANQAREAGFNWYRLTGTQTA
jgi:hypothetical protein